jgi:hypothetical protein
MSSKIREVEKQQGRPLKEVILALAGEGKSQAEIAKELGVSQSTISNWCFKLGITFNFKRVVAVRPIPYIITEEARAQLHPVEV